VPGNGAPDERYLFLSDVLPTAWQAVEYAAIPKGGSVAVYGLGPIGQMCARIARHQGAETVIGVDSVPERLEMARRHGVEAIDSSEHEDVPEIIREMTDGRGPDGVIDAVGMEAHGAHVAELAQKATGLLPDALAAKATEKVAVDRLSALLEAIDTVRRGGTISISGAYGGQLDPLPMMQLFDKGVQIRMGQAHVRRWTDEILPPAGRRRGSARRRRSHHPPAAAGRGAKRLRDVPEEGRRGDQGRPQALTRRRRSRWQKTTVRASRTTSSTKGCARRG
jgi:threonine dehydrogenase-like Zn-dependent dehydrogenase